MGTAPVGKLMIMVGLPTIISQAPLTIMTYGLNVILGQIKEAGEKG